MTAVPRDRRPWCFPGVIGSLRRSVQQFAGLVHDNERHWRIVRHVTGVVRRVDSGGFRARTPLKGGVAGAQAAGDPAVSAATNLDSVVAGV
jgi:hypothetical protein